MKHDCSAPPDHPVTASLLKWGAPPGGGRRLPPTAEDKARYVKENYLHDFLRYAMVIDADLIDNFVGDREEEFLSWLYE
ncbi:MAG: hypothetical protein LBL09_00665 [Oscillospiraceae bacterium]|jgi:hypothetical protein|nr:hypothetical protein [Oscillospiraceae bacterium]